MWTVQQYTIGKDRIEQAFDERRPNAGVQCREHAAKALSKTAPISRAKRSTATACSAADSGRSLFSGVEPTTPAQEYIDSVRCRLKSRSAQNHS